MKKYMISIKKSKDPDSGIVINKDELPIGIVESVHDVMKLFGVGQPRGYELLRIIKTSKNFTLKSCEYEITKF